MPAAPTPLPTLSADERQLFVAGLGIVGGLGVGYYAFQHLFVQGLTSDERRNMLAFAAGAASLWGLVQVLPSPYKEWIDPLHIVTPEEP